MKLNFTCLFLYIEGRISLVIIGMSNNYIYMSVGSERKTCKKICEGIVLEKKWGWK